LYFYRAYFGAIKNPLQFYTAKDLGTRDSNYHQLSGGNLAEIQGARSDPNAVGIVIDEQRRSSAKLPRPQGSQKMDDFFLSDPQGSYGYDFVAERNKSSHFLASQLDDNSNPASLRKTHY